MYQSPLHEVHESKETLPIQEILGQGPHYAHLQETMMSIQAEPSPFPVADPPSIAVKRKAVREEAANNSIHGDFMRKTSKQSIGSHNPMRNTNQRGDSNARNADISGVISPDRPPEKKRAVHVKSVHLSIED